MSFFAYHVSMGNRREKRLVVPVKVRIWGLDRDGKLFSQNVETVDITATGARLRGVTAKVDPGFVIGMQCEMRKARFVVTWVGHKGTPREGHIGLRASEEGRYLWGIALPRVLGDDFGEPSALESLTKNGVPENATGFGSIPLPTVGDDDRMERQKRNGRPTGLGQASFGKRTAGEG
ncbi:MAG TPA: hypothetical protein VKZ53_17335 [Candidatus Angelobacter sp.]|nr:hypothetical protein [Candidatus Angelobacter sp.]